MALDDTHDPGPEEEAARQAVDLAQAALGGLAVILKPFLESRLRAVLERNEGIGEDWSVRLDWIDPNAQEHLGVVLEDEARQWIEGHPEEARSAVDRLAVAEDRPLGSAEVQLWRRWIVQHPEQAVRIAAGSDHDGVVRALEGEWGTLGSLLALLAPLTPEQRRSVLEAAQARSLTFEERTRPGEAEPWSEPLPRPTVADPTSRPSGVDTSRPDDHGIVGL